jgi:hypothetical protein
MTTPLTFIPSTLPIPNDQSPVVHQPKSYAEEAVEKKIMNAQGVVFPSFSSGWHVSSPPQEAIDQFLHESSLYEPLLALASQGAVTLKTGVFSVCGKPFWQTEFQKLFGQFDVTELLWTFCDEPLQVFEVVVESNQEKPVEWISLPAKSYLCIHYARKITPHPMEPCFLKITNHDQKLQYTLQKSHLHSAQVFHDAVLHRLPLSQESHLIGFYIAAITRGGPLFNEAEARQRVIHIISKLKPSELESFIDEGKKLICQQGLKSTAYECNKICLLDEAGISCNPQACIFQVVLALHTKIRTKPLVCSEQANGLHASHPQLHLVMKADFEKALGKLEQFLESDPTLCCSLVAEILTWFFDLATEEIAVTQEDRWSSDFKHLYEKLYSSKKHYAAALYLNCLIHGQHLTGTDLIALPNALEETDILMLEQILQSLCILEIPPDVLKSKEAALQFLCLQPSCAPLWEEFHPDQEFLLKIAPTLDAKLLPPALKHVREKPSLELLTAYLDRLMQDKTMFVAQAPSLILLTAKYGVAPDFALKLVHYMTKNCPETLLEIAPFLNKHPITWDALLEVKNRARFLSFFAEQKDDRLVNKIISDKREDELPLLTSHLLKNKDSVRYLSLLGSLAAQKNPPLGCFKKAVSKDEFSPEQQKELASAFAHVLLKQMNHDIIQALPSPQWLFDNLSDATLFVNLLLAFPTKYKITVTDPVWLVQNLTDLPSGFTVYLQKNQERLKNLKWNEALRHLLSRFPKEKLFLDLWNLSKTKEQSAIYQECLNAFAKKDFDTIPNTLAGKKETCRLDPPLSNKPLPLENPKKALAQLKKEQCQDKHKWTLFFKAVSLLPPTSLEQNFMRETYSLWSKLFPLSQIKPDDGDFWTVAMQTFFSPPLLLSLELSCLLQSDPLPLILSLSPDNGKKCIAIFVKHGITYTWTLYDNAEKKQGSEFASRLYQFFTNSSLTAKIGNPWMVLPTMTQIDLALLACSTNESSVAQEGHLQFIQLQAEAEMDKDPLPFQLFCGRPYFPKERGAQFLLLQWIDEQWSLYRHQLDFKQKVELISYLANAHAQDIDSQQTQALLYDSARLYAKWQELATQNWAPLPPEQQQIMGQSPLTVAENHLSSFLTATYFVASAIKKPHPGQLPHKPLLAKIKDEALQFISSNASDPTYFSTHYTCLFDLSYTDKAELSSAWMTDRVKTVDALLSQHQPSQAITSSFAERLPDFLEVLAQDPSDACLNALKSLFLTLMKIGSFALTDPSEHYSWSFLLIQLSKAAPGSPGIEKLAYELFLSLLEQKQQDETLVSHPISAMTFCKFFLMQPLQSITEDDLSKAVHLIEVDQMGLIIDGLKAILKSHNTARFGVNISLARLFCFMPLKMAQTFAKQHLSNPESIILTFNPKVAGDLQLLGRAYWLKAVDRLSLLPLQTKRLLLKEFMLRVLLGLNDKNVATYLPLIKTVAASKNQETLALILEHLDNYKPQSDSIASQLKLLSQEIRL